MSGIRVRTAPDRGFLVDWANVRTRVGALALGRWSSLWEFGEIRVEPEPFMTRAPLAREMLSVMPLASTGAAELQIGHGKLELQGSALQGPLLRLRAQGWVDQKAGRADLNLEGEVARNLLQAMQLVEPAQAAEKEWEPFRFQAHGPLERLAIQFNSGFFTFSMNSQPERQP